MSHLTFKSYPGVGQYNVKHFNYSQTVKVGDIVYISGQGGWEDGEKIYEWREGMDAQIEQAFVNVEIALRDAGATMDNVFKIVTYAVGLTEGVTNKIVEETRQRFPNHAPLWTDIGVEKLGDEKMLIEVEVMAHIPPQK